MQNNSLRVTLALLLVLLTAPAYAQDNSTGTAFQVEHFEPLPSQGTNILNTGKSDVLGHLKPSGGVFFHYVDSPLRLVNQDDPDNDPQALIKNQLKTEIWGSFGLFDIGELGFVLPVVAFQSGDPLDVFGRSDSIDGFAISDLRIVPKVRVPVEREKLAGFGFSLVAPVYLPIGDTETFNSDGNVRVEPRLIVDWAHDVGIAVAGNVGYQVRQETTAQNIVTDDVLRYSLAAELPTGVENFQIIASVFGNVPTQGDISDEFENRSNPREFLAGVQYKLPYNLVANAGAGTGLSNGVGSPRFRVFASVGYTPMGDKDTDGDGIFDSKDGCPADPEDVDTFEDSDGCPDLDNDNDSILDTDDKCPVDAEDVDTFEDEDGCPDPDNDKDGIADVDDKCPLEAGVAEEQGCPIKDSDNDGINDKEDVCPEQPEDKDNYEDTDGCPDPDNDQDKVLDVDDKCPLEKEDIDKFEDEDGCPDLDNDNDNIPDEKDKCPDKPETYNGVKDTDGCPDKGKTLVKLVDNKIEILQKIFFDTGKDTIKKKSYKVLNVVATVLENNKSITKVSIEGHTDDVGDDAKNLDLSKRRAASVKAYLESKGIDSSRLVSEGFGEDKPLCKDVDKLLENKRKNRKKLKACRSDNRRVEFNVIEMNGKPVKGTNKVESDK